MENNVTLTNDQVKKVYDSLESADTNSNKELLEKAKLETENANYTSIEPTENTNGAIPIIGVDIGSADDSQSTISMIASKEPTTSNATESDFLEVFKDYNLSLADCDKFLKLIFKYKDDNNIPLYNELPQNIKNLADGFINMSKAMGEKLSKEGAAKLVIDNFINDAEINKAYDDYRNEMDDFMVEAHGEYKLLIQDKMDEVFNNIEEIRKENPEKAKTIEEIKQAFDDAESFTRVREYIKNTSIKKLKKAANRYDGEVIYFNKRVSSAELKIPNIGKLLPIIKAALPELEESQIKLFIVAISKSCYSLDPTNIIDISYIYKLISNITAYEFSSFFDSEDSKKIFENIKSVMLEI